MGLSSNINTYIKNSMIRGQLAGWSRGSMVSVYITPITMQIESKNFYYEEIKRAMQNWNSILKQNDINLNFTLTDSPQEANVIIHWTKVGRVFEGMCKYLSVIGNEIKKVSIEVGLENEYSPKTVTKESIFFVMMHEFGHALGLGHGVDVDDVMYVPHQKNISTPSENDLFVLKMIYSQN